MTLSDLEWPLHASRAISAVAQLFVYSCDQRFYIYDLWTLTQVGSWCGRVAGLMWWTYWERSAAETANVTTWIPNQTTTTPLADSGINHRLVKLCPLIDQTCFELKGLKCAVVCYFQGKISNSTNLLNHVAPSIELMIQICEQCIIITTSCSNLEDPRLGSFKNYVTLGGGRGSSARVWQTVTGGGKGQPLRMSRLAVWI